MKRHALKQHSLNLSERWLSGFCPAVGKKFTLPEVNERINELLKHSIKSEGVINLFSDVKAEFSLFDPKFLEEIANMKEKNLAVELLKKLIAEQVSVYRRTNIVNSEKFSELIQGAMNRYLNGMLTSKEIIREAFESLPKEIADANAEELVAGIDRRRAFYDALTDPSHQKYFERGELVRCKEARPSIVESVQWTGRRKESVPELVCAGWSESNTPSQKHRSIREAWMTQFRPWYAVKQKCGRIMF